MGLAEASLHNPPHTLVTWYLAHHREMPWRETQDPYAIWVSETMLQQTRVETVLPYFLAFTQQFPTVTELANAPEESVLKAWQGLGYYSRARNLHKAAKAVVMEHDGHVPENLTAFRNLAGVGPYTAGAVFSIAFNQPVPAVDGNVLRVMSRYLGIHDPIERAHVKQQIHHQVERWLQESEPRHLTQALMELGATVCTPRSPGCLICPLQSGCVAHARGEALQIPVRTPKKARKQVRVLALWCEAEEGVLLQQRPAEGLLGGMWQLPNVEVPLHEEIQVEEQLSQLMTDLWNGTRLEHGETSNTSESFVAVAEEKHIFTHIEWVVTVYRPVHWSPPHTTVHGVWTARDQMHRLPWPRVYEKLFEQVMKG